MKPQKMYALMNFDVIRDVAYLRKQCKQAGIDCCVGGEDEYRRMVRMGAFKIVPVIVTPLKPRRGK